MLQQRLGTRCCVHIAALLVFAGRFNGQETSLAGTSPDSLTVRCSTDCNGVNLCSGACAGEQNQIGKCQTTAECPKFSADACAGGPEPCQFSDWGEWLDDMNCTGLCTRKRTMTPNKCDGTPCEGPLLDTKRCPSSCGPHKDCAYSQWSNWDACGATTVNQRERTRTIAELPLRGGIPCEGDLLQTKECGTAITPSTDCKVSEWMDWAPCNQECGGGQHVRFRTILQKASGEGKACPAAIAQTDGCSNGPCLVGSGSPVDCAFGPWAQWSSCSADSQMTRQRVIQSPLQNDGQACQGTLIETAICGTPESSTPEDCVFQDWGPWNLCSRSCEGGQTYRERGYVPPKKGGQACNGTLKETKECSTHGCDMNSVNGACALSEWSMWSSCTVMCGVGSQNRSRTIKAQAHSGGRSCSESLAQTRGCPNNVACNVKDCGLSNWGAWTPCSASCGGGQSSRTRTILHHAEPGGKACEAGSMTEFGPCNTLPCPTSCVDGVWHDWSSWSFCTKTCKGGYYGRTRTFWPSSSCGMPVTGPTVEHASCNDDIECNPGADVDCRFGNWADWGACSSSCMGVRNRSRVIEQHGSGHGSYCGTRGQGEALVAVEPCGRPIGFGQAFGGLHNDDAHEQWLRTCGLTTPVDCEISQWSEWSACSATCMGGQQTRSRQILRYPQGAGLECKETLNETEPCNIHTSCMSQELMPENCTAGHWSEWGLCQGCTGQRFRTRSVKDIPRGNGAGCSAFTSQETEGCEKGLDCPGNTASVSPYFCIWTVWTAWSDCSATCGNGTRRRSQMMASTDMEPLEYAALAQTAEECFGQQHERTTCNLEDCAHCVPQDCVLSEWSEWTLPSCEGLCFTNRSVITKPNECGMPCTGSMRRTRECPASDFQCKKKDCSLTDWSGWTSCSSPVEQKYRKRTISAYPYLDGQACAGPLQDTDFCANTGDHTPVDCQFSPWGQWSMCDKPCGGGQQSRTRTVEVEAAHGGTACGDSLSETTSCASNACTAGGPGNEVGDCEFGPWSIWSSCNSAGGDIQAYRERQIQRVASEGRKACHGDTRETTSCPGVGLQDCLLSDWTSWGTCSATCHGGVMHRARSVKVYASPGGKLCNGDLIQMRSCNDATKCGPPQDCKLADWSMWSVCVPSGASGDATCGDGHKVRARSIKNPGEPRGKPCETNLEQVTPCRDALCQGVQDCKWQDWAEWQPCVKAAGPCGVGYKRRVRSIAQMPSKGGKLCKPKIKDELTPVVNCEGQKECCVDGAWGDWNEWAACSATCGGGTKERRRVIVKNATWCGREAEGSAMDYAFCKETNCSKVDCKFAEWGPWTPDIQVECRSQCAQGHVERTRTIQTPASRAGLPCVGPLHEWQRCPNHAACGGETHPPAKDCVLGEWSAWSPCSMTCEGGFRTHERVVQAYPEYGGVNCSSNSLKEVQECNADVPCSPLGNKVNCQWSDWTMWSGCVNGARTSTRGYATPAAHGGDPCTGPQSKTSGCGACLNATYRCEWTTWADWGSCSQTCGTGGKRTRTRSLQVGSAIESTKSAFDLPGLQASQAQMETASPNRLQDFVLAFGAGAAVLVVLVLLRPLMMSPFGKHVRSRTLLWLGREDAEHRLTLSEAAGDSSRSRSQVRYEALRQTALLEEGPAE